MEARVSVLICRGPSPTQLIIFPPENQVPAGQGDSHGGMQPLESGVCGYSLSTFHLDLMAVVWGNVLSIHFQVKFTHLSGKGQFRLHVADARITQVSAWGPSVLLIVWTNEQTAS